MNDLLTVHAREALGMPEEWQVYAWTCLPHYRSGQKDWKATHFQVTGCIAPIITRGKNKGRHNWRKMDNTTIREFVVSIADHEVWELNWERKTGKCYRCQGEGKTIARMTATEKTYRDCTRCKGTGGAQ
jgi:hypothetical protein